MLPLQHRAIYIPKPHSTIFNLFRQIALKALSERLSKTTDSSRQNMLPKSFPQTGASGKHHHHHHHGHGHGHHGGHHGGGHLPFPMTMDRPAIPLPPPPSKSALKAADSTKATGSSSASNSTTTADLINLDQSGPSQGPGASSTNT